MNAQEVGRLIADAITDSFNNAEATLRAHGATDAEVAAALRWLLTDTEKEMDRFVADLQSMDS